MGMGLASCISRSHKFEEPVPLGTVLNKLCSQHMAATLGIVANGRTRNAVETDREIGMLPDSKRHWLDTPWSAATSHIAGVVSATLAHKDGCVSQNEAEGVIKQMVGLLHSDQQELVQAALIALSLLTANCPENARAAHDAGALELFARHLASPTATTRAAAARAVRSICTAGAEYRKEFARLSGGPSIHPLLHVFINAASGPDHTEDIESFNKVASGPNYTEEIESSTRPR
mmetsp:Transcript_77198/g.149065  ORF Transcript_77198/g.149065 Transcript_77198/m.149065 type:complete len:232 (-) Transcript_77198:64-759(-)